MANLLASFKRGDIGRLQKAMSCVQDKRTYLRMEAVLLVAQGHRPAWVAAHQTKSRQVIYRWCALFLQHHNPYSLQEGSRSGRPLSAAAITEGRILRALQKNPLELGYRAGGWTVALLAHYLSGRYGCAVAPHTLRRRMKGMGLRYKRPRYVYEEKDPARVQKKGRSSAS
jgi:transposase